MVAAISFAVTFLASCHHLDEPEAAELSLRSEGAEAGTGSQFVAVKASGEWTLSIDFGNSAAAEADITRWAYLDNEATYVITGSGDRNDIDFHWSKNLSADERTLTLVLECAGATGASGSGKNGTSASDKNGASGSDRNGTITRTFTQKGVEGSYYSGLPKDIKSDPVPAWMELPALSDKLFFISHNMTRSGKEVRNYSYAWDTTALVAHWVAYPLNSALKGSGSRSDEWGLDPKLPRRYQPVVFRAYSSAGYGGDGWYNRGHQCPSADRLEYNSNVQTFYGTNMTPQMSELNAAAWGVLEGMVRDWSVQFDTLYVVTGCTVKGSTAKVQDNEGKEVTVPTGYFKALLGYKKSGTVGMTGSTGGYTGTAFWFDHQGYSGSRSVVMKQRITISALEQKTGIDFFVNLPDRIGAQKASTVESTIDSWWK